MLKDKIKSRIGELTKAPGKTGSSDFWIIALVTALVMFGVAMVFSASYYYALNRVGTPFYYLERQLFFAPTGFIIMYVMSKIDYHRLVKLTIPVMLLSLGLLIIVIAGLGTTVNNATRWIAIGPLTIMPGEFAKVAIVFFVSAFLAKDYTRIYSIRRGIFPILLVTMVYAALIVIQPNLSTAITVAGIAFGMMFLGGIKWRYIVLTVLGLTGTTAGLALFGYEHWKNRIVSFMDPFENSLGEGWQVAQSLLALGTGGVFGLGLGKSVQKNLYLPEPMNDFILSIIGEELGLIGVMVLMVVFMLLIWRIFRVAMHAPDKYGMLLSGGFGIMIALQVVLNTAVVTSSMPPTGIALPFISYGGNALWICMGACGIILNVSKQAVYPEKQDDGLSVEEHADKRRKLRMSE